MIFNNILEGLNNSLSLLKQDFVSWWHDFLWLFLSPMRLFEHAAYSVCYSVLYMQNVTHFISASAKDRAKNNHDNIHTHVFLFSILKYV